MKVDDEVDDAVSLLALLAHPVRVSVIAALRRRGPTAVGELAQALSVEQSRLSHHLRRLRQARLVATGRDGRRVLYRVVDDRVACLVEDALGISRGR